MNHRFTQSQIAIAVAAAIGVSAMGTASSPASAGKAQGKYLAGDFHNHSTCSDGSTSMQKLVKKSTDKVDTPWGLDWFVQAGHGGNGNRNCTLVEDATLDTPAYPFVEGKGPTTTWANSIGAAAVKGNAANGGVALSTQADPRMWRWQSVQEFQYQVMEYLSVLKNVPLFLGIESVVAGHEHTSMSVITGQMPESIHKAALPTTPGYTALGNANALAQWTYCFDRGDTDWSRGNSQIGVADGNNWDCLVTGSLNSADPSWNATAQKLVPAGGTGTGERGHNKTVEAIKWMKEFHPTGSYYVPAHLERAGPFNPNGNNGFNVEHLRNFNNAAPRVAFGFETQPGHHASDQRGEYTIRRNNFSGTFVDSVGGTTYGGTGVYGAQIGGVWDALLGEGRNFWFFANSDWHNRGQFGGDDRRSTQDFFPGEYQRNYTLVRDDGKRRHRRHDMLSPQEIVDGLRTGNTFADSGQLIDRLAFVACVGNRSPHGRSEAAVEALAVVAALQNTDIDFKGCATMGEKLVVRPGTDVIVSIVVRDPGGTNYSPYTFPNPSLAQIGISQPLNAPVLDHIDVIRGLVSGYRTPGTSDYAGEWPRDWIQPYLTGNKPSLDTVPAAAKNATAALLRTFDKSQWKAVPGKPEFKRMTFRLRDVEASQYLRLRGTNLPPSVPYETDADGNPLPDIWTNSSAVNPSVQGGTDGFPANHFLRIPCTSVGTTEFDGCPSHLPVVDGVKYLALDVAAWADLWFYSNPIYIQVDGSFTVAGVE
jgi:hypothetical protein